MDSQQAAQEEALVEAGGGSPADPGRGGLRCAVAGVMGLVNLALVIGFILHVFMFTPSCRQEAPLSAAGSVYTSTKLQMSDEDGRYDIFTVNKTARYFIYGWVRLSEVSGEELDLRVADMAGGSQPRTIQKSYTSQKEVFFNRSILMTHGLRVSLYLKSAFTDSLFHLYEL